MAVTMEKRGNTGMASSISGKALAVLGTIATVILGATMRGRLNKLRIDKSELVCFLVLCHLS